MELSRIANQSANQNNGQTSRAKSLDEIVKMVRLLTVKVPNKSDGWEYFFSSLEKAFASEMVSDELKPKVLLCMLGDKVSNLLVNLGEEELKDYESLNRLYSRKGTEIGRWTVAARVDVLGKVIPRRAIEDKLSKLVKNIHQCRWEISPCVIGFWYGNYCYQERLSS
ncbi:retrovirus-related Pol polyprotein from transposon opus [Trichonephila clavipes]|nr:retrovirus-related Pol polyprotein from transposon opus [Trichonephila clavipes]